MVIIKWEEKCGKFSGLVVVPVVSVLQIYIFRYNGYWVWDNEENLVVVIVILVLEISVFWFEVISIFWVIVCLFFWHFYGSQSECQLNQPVKGGRPDSLRDWQLMKMEKWRSSAHRLLRLCSDPPSGYRCSRKVQNSTHSGAISQSGRDSVWLPSSVFKSAISMFNSILRDPLCLCFLLW